MAEVERIELALTLAPIRTPDGALVRPSSAILTNLPAGAVPSAGFPYDDGEWLLNESDLDGLTVSVPKARAGDFRPSIMAFYEDDDGGINSRDAADFEAVPVNAVGTGAAVAGPGIPLDLSIAVNGLGPADQVYDVTVTGLPAGARLSAGFDNADGTWTLLPDEFHAVSLIVPKGFAGPLTLAYTAVGIGPHGEVHSHNAAADFCVEDPVRAANGECFFGPGSGRGHYTGQAGAVDVVHLVGVGHGPSARLDAADDWTVVLDNPSVAVSSTDRGMQFGSEVSGSIVLGDGSVLTFVDVTRIDW